MRKARACSRALSLLLALALSFALSAAAFAETPDALGARLDAYIEERRETTAGLALAVFDRDGLIYQKNTGFADIENALPVSGETVFEWGSATKLLVWVSAMQLWEQGKLDLNADVRDYLPEGFLNNLRYNEPVTMLHLMNHTAGFQEMVFDLFTPEGADIPALADALRRHEPMQVYAPGTVTAYSNWGAALAGYLVERVSGQRFADYVHTHIFAPLGMAHTAIAPDLSDNPWVQARRAALVCYTPEGGSLGRSFYHIPLYPAGMATGTPEDFTRFGMALLAEDCPLFEKEGTRAALFSPSDTYGDGVTARNLHGFWAIPLGVSTVGHGGNTAGCSSYLLLDLEGGRGVTVMTNQSGEEVYNVELMPLIFGAYEPSGQEPPKGLYRSARVALHGPVKLISLGFSTIEAQEDAGYWCVSGEQVQGPYGDMLRVSPAVVALELGLALLYALGLLFSLGTLLAWPLGALWRALRKKEKRPADARRGLRRWAAVLQLALAVTLLAVIVFLSAYMPSVGVLWLFPLCCLLALAMGALLLLLWKRRDGQARLWNVLSGVFLVVTIANVLYWELWHFWIC